VGRGDTCHREREEMLLIDQSPNWLSELERKVKERRHSVERLIYCFLERDVCEVRRDFVESFQVDIPRDQGDVQRFRRANS
jgi:hypothetical protein